MTAGEYGTPIHYLKGKDIKQQGDCLVYCYTRRIERIAYGEWNPLNWKVPEGFEKW